MRPLGPTKDRMTLEIDHDYQKLTDSNHKPRRFITWMMGINLFLIVAIAVMWWMI